MREPAEVGPRALLWQTSCMNPRGHQVTQIATMAATFLIIIGVFDSIYAVLADPAGPVLSDNRARLFSRLGAGALLGGGLWLPLACDR